MQNWEIQDVQTYLSEYYKILDEMISGMRSVCPSQSISGNFILRMIPHHRAAIRMSENLLKYQPCEELAEIAEGIISEQTKSIADMEQIVVSCREAVNCRAEACRYERRTQEIMNLMFRQMRCACSTGNINADFMREMIPHHCGAIRMSKNALSYPICADLQPILEAIITSQEQGVRQMQALLR